MLVQSSLWAHWQEINDIVVVCGNVAVPNVAAG